MAFSVFISYSTSDLVSATALRSWITAAGAQAYLAEYTLLPGLPIAEEIATAIRNCDLFLLLWSLNARSSEWVPQEIGVAKGAGRAILPVVLQPGVALPGFIRDLKYLDLYTDPMTGVQWLHDHIAALVKRKGDGALVAAGVIGALLLLLTTAER